jgi:hypothetical protein
MGANAGPAAGVCRRDLREHDEVFCNKIWLPAALTHLVTKLRPADKLE